MNTAIRITCLLIEAAEESVELKVDGGLLRVRAGAAIDPMLRSRLQVHKAGIIERFNYDAAHPDPFKNFFDQCCLFYSGKALVAPAQEVSHAYQQFARQSNMQALPTALLNRRLRELGCEAINVNSSLFWEHICLFGTGITSSPANDRYSGIPMTNIKDNTLPLRRR